MRTEKAEYFPAKENKAISTPSRPINIKDIKNIPPADQLSFFDWGEGK